MLAHEQKVNSSTDTPKFFGLNSYARYDLLPPDWWSYVEKSLQLKFSVCNENGLLLYQHVTGNPDDFFAIYVFKGYLFIEQKSGNTVKEVT